LLRYPAHSKWAWSADTVTIPDLHDWRATVCSQHGILGRLMSSATPGWAFARVALAWRSTPEPTHLRPAPGLMVASNRMVAYFLSGILIGAEIGGAAIRRSA
jgi:hypothetical protein